MRKRIGCGTEQVCRGKADRGKRVREDKRSNFVHLQRSVCSNPSKKRRGKADMIDREKIFVFCLLAIRAWMGWGFEVLRWRSEKSSQISIRACEVFAC